MSLPRTPADKNVKPTNLGASPTLPPNLPPEPKPPDKSKSPVPTTSQSDLDPSKMLPQSFFDTVIGSGTKKRAHFLE